MENYTDNQLLEAIAAHESAAKAEKEFADKYRTELLRRMVRDGVQMFEHAGWQGSLAKEPISFAWLKRQHGYEPNDLPPGIVKEKIVPDLDGAALLAWLAETGHETTPTYALRVKRSKP